MKNQYYKKYIRIPPHESIDIRKISPIIHHPLFQRLLHISQLGTTLTVFPGAAHNRFEHAMGVYAKTRRFCFKMLKAQLLTKHEVENVSLFGLLHDIGHGPFSHVIEGLTPVNHDKNGFKIIEQLKSEINKAGGDYAFIKKLFSWKDPLHKIVMDKNMGMDKLDYLERDVYHTGFGQRPDIESIFNYLVFIKGQLVIDKKSLEAAKQMQRLYTYMYKEVHLHKSSLIAGRFLEKMVSILLRLEKIDPSELWLMNDTELIAKIYTNDDPRLKYLYNSYKNRDFPKTGLVIRLKDREFKERIAGKSIKVIGENQKFFDRFLKHSLPQELEKWESLIANAVGVEDYKIILVPTLFPWRFVPSDILYHDDGKIFSLKKTHREYFDALDLEMSDYLAIRVCIVGDRKRIYKSADMIYRLIKKRI
jgi:uncharacterized protein